MPDQAVTTLLTGAGGAIAIAGVWLLCIITGLMVPGRSYARLEKENDDLKAALDAQARRADAAVEAAHTTNLILAGIRREASGP